MKVLDKISHECVFIIEREDENFRITEDCDQYYSVLLTKAELLDLAHELIELANQTK